MKLKQRLNYICRATFSLKARPLGGGQKPFSLISKPKGWLFVKRPSLLDGFKHDLSVTSKLSECLKTLEFNT